MNCHTSRLRVPPSALHLLHSPLWLPSRDCPHQATLIPQRHETPRSTSLSLWILMFPSPHMRPLLPYPLSLTVTMFLGMIPPVLLLLSPCPYALLPHLLQITLPLFSLTLMLSRLGLFYSTTPPTSPLPPPHHTLHFPSLPTLLLFHPSFILSTLALNLSLNPTLLYLPFPLPLYHT